MVLLFIASVSLLFGLSRGFEGVRTNRRPCCMHLVLETGLLHQALDIGYLLRKGDILGADLEALDLVIV